MIRLDTSKETLYENKKNSERPIFLGSKITADGDCSRDIKRRLFTGRKAMTNLDSILKSRGIILVTKFCLVKAMTFPVVMRACESWTINAVCLVNKAMLQYMESQKVGHN